MPLGKKENKILTDMKARYGPKKGKSVFYASARTGKLGGAIKKKHFPKG